MTAVAFAPTLRRLRNMQAGEIRFRASVALRNAMDRARTSVSPPAWDRGSLALNTASSPALEAARDSLARQDWMGAHRALADYFQRRTDRFVLAPSRAGSTARSIRLRWPDMDTHTTADRVVAGRYDLLGHRDVPADIPPNWHRDPVSGHSAPMVFWHTVPYLDPATGDHKVTWELNRHQHFLALGRAFQLTGDERYYREFVTQLASWLRSNPPLMGTNWASMLELAFRCLSWWWALQFFAGAAGDRDDHPWLVDLLLGLDRQLLHVERHLSRYFSPNTHLTGEALALYVVGSTLPELGDAVRRADVGRSVLKAEATRQVNPDGGHAELSAHYHRYSTDFYLLALNVARLCGDSAQPLFKDVVHRQAVYLRTLADDSGRLPLLGDDDGGQLFPIGGRLPDDCRDSLAHAAVLLELPSLAVGETPEETYWFCANHEIHAPDPAALSAWPSRRFEVSGYCVSRNDRGDHLLFDCGRHGYLNGGHAHADALSIVLTVGSRPLLIDPGTATYTMDRELRDRFRSTAMHNTVVVDGRPQSEPKGAFHWASATDAVCTLWIAGSDVDYAEGRHEGYGDLTHLRRVLAIHGVGWLIVDRLAGPRHRVNATAMWHLHPSWSVSRGDARRVRLRSGDVELALVSTAPIDHAARPYAVYSPVYGYIEEAPCLAATVNGETPVTIATFIPASATWLPQAIHVVDDTSIEVVTSRQRLLVTLKAGEAPMVQRVTECAE